MSLRLHTVQLKCGKLGRSALVSVDIYWECDLSRPIRHKNRHLSLSTKIVGDSHSYLN